jgi:hypothetical protein
MKNIKSLILISIIGILSFAEFAFGQEKARNLSYLEGANIALSPYAQAVPNDSYTFIGISHPSLQTAAARIGVAVEVFGMTGTVNSQAGRSSVFTVNGGETHRVFIVNQSHASINTSNAAFTDSRTHIIPTVNSPQFGGVRVSTVDESPNTLKAGATNRSNVYSDGTVMNTDCANAAHVLAVEGCGYSNLNQLNMWGIVYSEAAGTGFAMEFIGDMQDSIIQTGLCRGSLKLGSRGGISHAGKCGKTIEAHAAELGINEPPNSLTNSRPGAGVN